MLQRRLLLLSLLLIATPALAQLRWRENVDYQVIAAPIQRADAPADKIEVAEVFSYGCIHCFRAKENMARLAASLPADAVMTYVHASFLPSEGWPMFQRAYYTARQLGLVAATHEAMFRATWETGEVPFLDILTGTVRRPLPTIEDAAKFYARATGVTVAKFLEVANSKEIDKAVQQADELVKQWRVPGTPALVVNGRYLVDNSKSPAQQAQVVNFLIELERARAKK